MVSVLALNKLELKDMINCRDGGESGPRGARRLRSSARRSRPPGRRARPRSCRSTEENPVTAEEKKDPFEEIDFGSFFQEYLDPGYRSQSEMEDIERPSFENFLSKPTTLTDHLAWQLGALSLTSGSARGGRS